MEVDSEGEGVASGLLSVEMVGDDELPGSSDDAAVEPVAHDDDSEGVDRDVGEDSVPDGVSDTLVSEPG